MENQIDRQHAKVNILCEGVCEASESAHSHPHRGVLALDMRIGVVRRISTYTGYPAQAKLGRGTTPRGEGVYSFTPSVARNFFTSGHTASRSLAV